MPRDGIRQPRPDVAGPFLCAPIIEEVSARVQWGETEKIPRDFFKPRGGGE